MSSGSRPERLHKLDAATMAHRETGELPPLATTVLETEQSSGLHGHWDLVKPGFIISS